MSLPIRRGRLDETNDENAEPVSLGTDFFLIENQCGLSLDSNAGEPRRIRVGAHCARRYDFADALGPDRAWSGQAFVWGPNRVNLFFLNHSYADPCSIVTMEHSEVYRGEPAYVPMLDEPMGRLYRWKKRVFDGVVR